MLRQYIRVCSHRAVFRERVEAKSWCRTGPSRARKRHLRTHDAHSARATPRNRTGFMRVGKAPESPPGPHPRKRVEAKSWCRTGRSHARKRHLRTHDAHSARATPRNEPLVSRHRCAEKASFYRTARTAWSHELIPDGAFQCPQSTLAVVLPTLGACNAAHAAPCVQQPRNEP